MLSSSASETLGCSSCHGLKAKALITTYSKAFTKSRSKDNWWHDAASYLANPSLRFSGLLLYCL